MDNKTIGRCSICGGAVTVPTVWFGVVPPTPTCQKCGAIASEGHGPTIPMSPAPKVRTSTTGTTDDVAPDFVHTETTGDAKCPHCGCKGAHYCTGKTGTASSVIYRK